MKLILLQTSDGFRYKKLLDISSSINQFYCNLRGYIYNSYIGIKRGSSSIHATYNRGYLLKELIDSGYDGWVLYVDADAFVYDLNFDAINYILECGDYDFIAAEASDQISENWAINAGIFFINLGSNVGKSIVFNLVNVYEAFVPKEYWDDPEAGWAPSGYDDQNLLYSVLAQVPGVLGRVKKVSGKEFNYQGKHIRQILRVDGSIQEREVSMRDTINELIYKYISNQMSDISGIFKRINIS